jgi:hypothetical protein
MFNSIEGYKTYCLFCLSERRNSLKDCSSFDLPYLTSIDVFQPYNQTIKSAREWIGNFSPAIEKNDGFLRYVSLKSSELNEWKNLPDLPKWWLHDTEVAMRRRVLIVNIFDKEKIRFGFSLNVNCSYIGETKIWFDGFKFPVPQTLHVFDWIRNLQRLSKDSFFRIFQKISNKY